MFKSIKEIIIFLNLFGWLVKIFFSKRRTILGAMSPSKKSVFKLAPSWPHNLFSVTKSTRWGICETKRRGFVLFQQLCSLWFPTEALKIVSERRTYLENTLSPTILIKTLSYSHCSTCGEAKFSSRFLLKGWRCKWCRWTPSIRFRFNWYNF